VIGKDGVQFKDPEQFSQFLVAFVHVRIFGGIRSGL